MQYGVTNIRTRQGLVLTHNLLAYVETKRRLANRVTNLSFGSPSLFLIDQIVKNDSHGCGLPQTSSNNVSVYDDKIILLITVVGVWQQ